MAKVLRRRSAGTAATIAVAVLMLIAVPAVGAGRPGRRLRAAPTTMTTAAAAAAMKPDQTATESSAGPSGCSNSPSNGGARCPHRQISSTNPSNQTTN